MKRIIVATDLSPRSDRAMERAVRLVQEHGATLTVLHVVDDKLPEDVADRAAADAETAIRAQVASIADGALLVNVDVAQGRPSAEILRITAKREAGVELLDDIDSNLLVLGTHREDSLRDLFVDTTASRVLRESVLPVLVVKERASEPYSRALVAVDFSEHSRTALRLACLLLPGSEISALHVFHVPFSGFLRGAELRHECAKDARHDLDKMIGEIRAEVPPSSNGLTPTIRAIVQEGEVLEVVWRECKRRQDDLLVLGTHGRRGLGHAVMGSVAEALLSHPPCDVLAVRARTSPVQRNPCYKTAATA